MSPTKKKNPKLSNFSF